MGPRHRPSSGRRRALPSRPVPDEASWTIVVPEPRVEPTPRRIRVRVGDTLVADSRRALLLAWYGPGMLPTYCLPDVDVRTELLTPSASPGDGTTPTVDHDIEVDGHVLPRAARQFRDAPASLSAVDGHWTFPWDEGVSWFEEALEVHVHARDPSTRVDAVPTDRHVRITIGDVVVAASGRGHALFETGLPTRWYLPPDDVDADLLVPSDTVSRCPYKGTAAYWSVRIGDTLHADVAWSYAEPVVECPRIAGLVAFLDERVDVDIDGVRQERPRTPWSS